MDNDDDDAVVNAADDAPDDAPEDTPEDAQQILQRLQRYQQTFLRRSDGGESDWGGARRRRMAPIGVKEGDGYLDQDGADVEFDIGMEEEDEDEEEAYDDDSDAFGGLGAPADAHSSVLLFEGLEEPVEFNSDTADGTAASNVPDLLRAMYSHDGSTGGESSNATSSYAPVDYHTAMQAHTRTLISGTASHLGAPSLQDANTSLQVLNGTMPLYLSTTPSTKLFAPVEAEIDQIDLPFVPMPSQEDLARTPILARTQHALALNQKYQRILQAQLNQVEQARLHLSDMQSRIKDIVIKNRLASQQGIPYRRHAPPFFVDRNGQVPPDNEDTNRKRQQLEHVPMMFTWKPWVKIERTRLAAGVRLQNQRTMLHRLQAKLDQGQITKEQFLREADKLKRLPGRVFEKNLEDINWDQVATAVGNKRSAEDCLIQWLNEHPVINHSPWTREEEVKLLQVASDRGARDWITIAEAVGNGRTALQCFRKYLGLDHATSLGSRWTEDEDEILREAVRIHGEKNWQQVASHLANRSGQQCLHRWEKTLKPSIRRGRWSQQEDDLLREAVKVHGVGVWNKIQHHVPGRTDVQCRERWCNVLNPDIKSAPWTKEEDEMLRQAAQKYDRKWADVAKVMAPRTDNQCWRRWKSLESQMSPYREYSLRRQSPTAGKKSTKGQPTLARMLAHPKERPRLLKMFMQENFRINTPAEAHELPVDRMIPPSVANITALQNFFEDLQNPTSCLQRCSNGETTHASTATPVPTAPALPPNLADLSTLVSNPRGVSLRQDPYSSSPRFQTLKERFNAMFFWPMVLATVGPHDPHAPRSNLAGVIKTPLANRTPSTSRPSTTNMADMSDEEDSAADEEERL